ncbi:hypothetical protein D3C86_2234570 [compost metagenome]
MLCARKLASSEMGSGAGRIIIAMTSGAACGSAELPVLDMIDVRDRTRAGCSLAMI